MSRRLRWSVFGAGVCAAAVLVTTLSIGPSDPLAGTPITVPQAQGIDPETSQPAPSAVTILLPSAPVDIPPSTPAPAPTSPERRRPATTQRPAPPPPPASIDFQAENARIRYGQVDSDHPGFTGSGFANYDNVAGSSVEWTVPTPAAGAADVVFRFANGSAAPRPMVIALNETPVEYVLFSVTNGWSDWRTLTVHVNLPAGTNIISATATTRDGGPNVDKITLA